MVLHALIDPSLEAIALFSEVHNPVIRRTCRKKKPSVETMPVYPNGSIDGLADLISHLTGCQSGDLKKRRWVVRLPVVDGMPLVSLPIHGIPPGTIKGRVPLLPYYIPVILCPCEIFPDLWVKREELQHTYILGDSLRFIFHLMRFSIHLVKNGRFKPVIRRSATGYHADYEPSMTPEESTWLKEYSALIPPLCRYVSPRKTDRKTICSPYSRVNASLTTMVQVIIKRH